MSRDNGELEDERKTIERVFDGHKNNQSYIANQNSTRREVSFVNFLILCHEESLI